MEYEIKPTGRLSINLKELWEYKELFYFFTWRDVKVKYKQTALGLVWAVLQPAAMMVVFTFVFGRIINEQTATRLPYPVFVYIGLMLWGIFSGGLQAAGNSMVSNSNIIKKIYFPRLIIPMSSILVSVFDFLMTLIPFVGLLIYYHIPVDIVRLIWVFPMALFLILTSTFGAGLFLAALNVKYRDFRYVLPFLIQFLMFVTPVIYPMQILDNKWLMLLLKMNPIGNAISLFRSAFDGSAVDLNWLLISFIITSLMLVFGVFYFRKTESYFADLI